MKQRRKCGWVTAGVVIGIAILAKSAMAGAGTSPGGTPIPGTAFRQYQTKTDHGTAVTYYLSEAVSRSPVPLVVWIPGTGCSSHFGRDGERITSGLQSILASRVGDRGRVLAVEKPGVQFLDPEPENSSHCSSAFRERYTLESWSEAIATAIASARLEPGVDSSRLLVVGHSEGGLVAMRVSNVSPWVTHVASLSAGGPVALFPIAQFTRQKGLNPETEVFNCWAEIERDPDSSSRFCWGGTYRQWSSFMATSLIEEALRSRARLYFAHGSADEHNSVAGFDVLRAELAARRREAVFNRIEGADHALSLPGQAPPEGIEAVFDLVLQWVVARPASAVPP